MMVEKGILALMKKCAERYNKSQRDFYEGIPLEDIHKLSTPDAIEAFESDWHFFIDCHVPYFKEVAKGNEWHLPATHVIAYKEWACRNQ